PGVVCLCLVPGSSCHLFLVHSPCHLSHWPGTRLQGWAAARHAPLEPCTAGGRRTGLTLQTVVESCHVIAYRHGSEPERLRCSWRAHHSVRERPRRAARIKTMPIQG